MLVIAWFSTFRVRRQGIYGSAECLSVSQESAGTELQSAEKMTLNPRSSFLSPTYERRYFFKKTCLPFQTTLIYYTTLGTEQIELDRKLGYNYRHQFNISLIRHITHGSIGIDTEEINEILTTTVWGNITTPYQYQVVIKTLKNTRGGRAQRTGKKFKDTDQD
jgi:hypothetical protein